MRRRWEWSHGIAPRLADVIDGALVPRGRRVSLTLRALAPLPDAEGGVGGEGGEGVGGSGGVLPHKQSRERSGDELGGGEDRGVSRQRTDQRLSQ